MRRSPMPPRQSPMRRSTELTRTRMKAKRKPQSPEEVAARIAVERRAKGRCEGCGRPGRCEWAHRVGRAQGGPFSAENGLWLCGDMTGGRAPTPGGGCHPYSHSFAGRPVCEARGWILRSHHDPATTPALIHGVGLCLLAADGTYIPFPEERSAMSPNYVQSVLDRLHAASPGLAPELAQLYALLALTKGADTSLEDVHDAWALYRMTTRPDHPSLIPFEQLSPEVQELDRPFQQAIHKAAQEAA